MSTIISEKIVSNTKPNKSKNKKQNKKNAGSTTQVVVVDRKPRRKNNAPNNFIHGARGIAKNAGYADMEVLWAYINSLNDPFLFPPVRLGFQTFLPSNVATLYKRLVLTSTDGGIGVAVLPAYGLASSGFRGGLVYTTAQALSIGSNATSWTNRSPVLNMGTEARVISYGIRVQPLLSGNDISGVIHCTNVPSCSWNLLVTQTGATIVGDPLTRWSQGNVCAQVNGRPQDADSFSFQDKVTLGYPDADILHNSVPVIVCTGFPTACQFMVEAVLNVEILQSVGSSFNQYTGNENLESLPTVADVIPEPSSLWKAVHEEVFDAVLFDGVPSHDVYSRNSNGRMRIKNLDAVRNGSKRKFNAPPHVTGTSARGYL